MTPTANDRERWRRIPKVELHLHLDTTIPFDVACRLEPGLTHATYLAEFRAPARVGSLSEFLRRCTRQVALLQDAAALRLQTEAVVCDLADDGVAYAELRFAPLQHLERGMTAGDAVGVVADAMRAASAATGVELGLILCTLRHYDAEQSMATARLVIDHQREGIPVGFDLAGDEINHPLDAHLPAFAAVRSAGLPFTVHAGEAGGPGHVIEVLDALAPTRIGHGLHSIEDPALVARLAASKVHLELCPSCNVQTEAVASYADHPIARLADAGVEVGISTDQRTITEVTLSSEYARLHEAFGWTETQLLRCNESALRASFASDEVKRRVHERLLAS